jgi:hypothetical protein
MALSYVELMVSCVLSFLSSSSDALQILIWVLWSVAFLLTVLRGILKWHSQRRFFADDHFVLFSLLSLTALSAVITCLLPQFYLVDDYQNAALDNPFTPLPLPPDEFIERTRTSLKLMFSQMLLFWTTLWAGKLGIEPNNNVVGLTLSAKFSILFFFKRVVHGLPKYMKAWWACFVMVLALYLASMASNFLTCRPLSKYWSSSKHIQFDILKLSRLTCKAGCSDPEDLVRADISIKFATSADVVADILIMILPLNLLRKLQVSPHQKFGLTIIFSLGTVIIAFAIARLVQVTKATNNPDPSTLANGPVLLSMWSHIESSVSVIVATLPAFRWTLNSKLGRTGVRPSATPAYDSAPNKASGATSKSKAVLSGRGWSHRDSTRLHSIDRRRPSSTDWGSETELRPIGGIEKQVDYTVETSVAMPHAK